MKQQPEVTQNVIRLGKPSSSKAYLLIQSGQKQVFSAKCIEYLDTKVAEIILGKTSEIKFYSKQTAWGDFCEMFIFHESGYLGSEYKYIAQNTQEHHSIKGWVGTPDYIVDRVKKVSDCKAYYPANFLAYILTLRKNDLELFKTKYKKEYWQLVSNAGIKGFNIIEPIAFLPKEETLLKMGAFAENIDSEDQFKYKFISDDGLYGGWTLPHMANDSEIEELNKFQFTVPQEDLDLVESRFKIAIQYIADEIKLFKEGNKKSH